MDSRPLRLNVGHQSGTLLMYHGWADVALSAHMSTDCVDRVYAPDIRQAPGLPGLVSG